MTGRLGLAGLLLASTPAVAHHGTGTTQVSAPSLPPPTAEADGDETTARVGLRYDLVRLDRRIQDERIDPAEAPVSMHRATLSGGVSLPGGRSLGVGLPVGLVQRTDGASVGPGDLALWLGQGVGGAVRLQVEAGLTAPTGRYEQEAVHSAVDMQGLDDGQFLIATYDTRTSLGAGSWSAQARTALAVPLGPASARVHGTLSQPLDRTPDGYRWGRDVVAGGVVASPFLGPLGIELGADRRWHQTDRFAFVDEETGEPLEQPVGRRASTAVTAALALRLSERTRCRVDGHRVVAQQADGIQLTSSGGVGGGCQLLLPVPKRRAAAQVAETEADDDPWLEAPSADTADTADTAGPAGEPANLAPR
jgi:hypothetical protein